MSSNNQLTNRVTEFRHRLHISQATLAFKVNISRQALSAIEQGKVNPSVIVALKLAIYLEVSVDTLFKYNWWPND